MNKSGPKPKLPSEILSAKSIPGNPTCPKSLDKVAKAKWAETTEHLAALGILSRTDGDALALYCVLFSRWHDAEHDIKVNGLTFTTDSGFVRPNPHIGISNDCSKQMKTFLEAFGLTPQSRAKVNAQKDEAVDPKWQEPE